MNTKPSTDPVSKQTGKGDWEMGRGAASVGIGDNKCVAAVKRLECWKVEHLHLFLDHSAGNCRSAVYILITYKKINPQVQKVLTTQLAVWFGNWKGLR